MTTVYVVTSGTYSDYGIERIFSTRELAQTYRDNRPPGHGEARIEEHELDSDAPQFKYTVEMDREGRALSVMEWYEPQEPGTFHHLIPAHQHAHHDTDGAYLHVFATARDTQHAIKIANEIRTRLIAENQWPEEN